MRLFGFYRPPHPIRNGNISGIVQSYIYSIGYFCSVISA